MPVSESRRAANDRYDRAHMAYQTVKVRRDLLDAFRAAVAERGERVNTVLRHAIEQYIADTRGKST